MAPENHHGGVFGRCALQDLLPVRLLPPVSQHPASSCTVGFVVSASGFRAPLCAVRWRGF
jgi:hypothetical protein